MSLCKHHLWGRFVSIILLTLTLSLAACGQQPASQSTDTVNNVGMSADSPGARDASLSGEITVFAAASLTEAYQEIAEAFQTAYPKTSVLLNLAGSQQLAQQLAQGAPADVFASANIKQMGVAIEAERVTIGTHRIFAHNRLVIIVNKESPIAIERLEDLAKPDLKLVLAAKEVPVGAYTLDFLDKAAQSNLGNTYREQVLGNVVSYEQTVKAVLTKVMLGEGDAGVVYSSDITAEAAEHVVTSDIPDHLNTIADYPIAVINDSAQPDVAQAFVDFVFAPEGQALLEKHGFLPAGSLSGTEK
jgi:molybdate transport system substrate-binding protein